MTRMKHIACDLLLQQRVQQASNATAKRATGIRVTMPQERRDTLKAEPWVPESVLALRAQEKHPKKAAEEAGRELQIDKERVGGGAGMYVPDQRLEWDIKNDEERYDMIPEICEGKNISDFVDVDILKKIAALEARENHDAHEEQAELVNDEALITAYQALMRDVTRIWVSNPPRANAGEMPLNQRQSKHNAKRQARDAKELQDIADMEADPTLSVPAKRRLELAAQAGPRTQARQLDTAMRAAIRQEAAQSKYIDGKQGFGDKIIPNEKPRHLFSGKAGFERQWR
ncbi:hypothetical protein KIPB_008209 [Kipferlia bialata]|uniref:NOG C-terminal domain-containing protein n=1 Tax=Kipferlia bialata TaxID=797122 RepID=A0A391P4D2_9EUKA|nr:hypothetical protein KIPB_008209 [Kipferlia bialata]|eukprot:g8209.t1